jgi:hypothetical protein
MEQQTAVEWYNEQLNLYGDMAFNKEISLGQYHIKKQELFEKAKEMEKEKMIDAIIFSEREHYIMGECWPTQTVIDKAERYYNETFKNK